MEMTDLEMTKLGAEAMGLRVEQYAGSLYALYEERPRHRKYCPLHDDSQAMALVKRFHLRIMEPEAIGNDEWGVYPRLGMEPCFSVNLNRAIVESVAKMQVTSPVA